ncbi:MAG: DUF4956 domain-containing protein [Clostridium sp.]|nr:DUF4956 domain-containing protein [Clostridium sp.]MCI5915400.1 DUF4956 domain-containing protein [Christensenella sp.]
MTFNDIFKSSFLEEIASFSILDMVIALALAFAMGLFINFIYRKTFRGVMFSKTFGVALMALTMITTLVILAVTSNVVLSLGMVGALSIVRFRTAIKEPLDIAFLFWSIAVGIVLGAGLIPLAVFGSIVIGGMLLLFAKRRGADAPYLLVLRCRNEAAEQAAAAALAGQVKRSAVKSKTVTDAGIELTLEVALSSAATSFVNALNSIEGVESASLVSYNGDYTA